MRCGSTSYSLLGSGYDGNDPCGSDFLGHDLSGGDSAGFGSSGDGTSSDCDSCDNCSDGSLPLDGCSSGSVLWDVREFFACIRLELLEKRGLSSGVQPGVMSSIIAGYRCPRSITGHAGATLPRWA